MKLKTALLPLTMPLLLAACLGGGGGGGGGGSSGGQSGPLTLDSTPTTFTSTADITTNSLVQATTTESVNYRGDIVGGDLEVTGDLSFEGSVLRQLFTTSTTEPEATRLTVNLPASQTVVRDFEDPAAAVGTGASASRYVAYEIDDGGVTDRLQLNVGEGLTYLNFGLWELDLDQTTVDIGGAAWGATTPLSGTGAMPIAGTATYEGDLIGYNVLAASTDTYVADSTLAADFGAGTVTFSSANTVNLATGAAAAAFNIAASTGTITGNSFSGVDPQLVGNPPGTFDGSFGGNFYGPDAAEAGGWFEIRNTGNSDRYFGSFGGAEVP
jgi:hypothetical protein